MLPLLFTLWLACGDDGGGSGERESERDHSVPSWKHDHEDAGNADEDAAEDAGAENEDAGAPRPDASPGDGGDRDGGRVPPDASAIGGNDVSVDATRPPSVPTIMPVASNAFSGTWQGKLTGSDGKTRDATFVFSANGYFIFAYRDSSNVLHQIEMMAAGQKLPMMLSNGGVQTIQVKEVVRSASSMSVSYSGEWEDSDASGSYQDFFDYSYQFALQGEALSVTENWHQLNYVNGANTSEKRDTSRGSLLRRL